MAPNDEEHLLKEITFDLASEDVSTRRHALMSIGRLSPSAALLDVLRDYVAREKNDELRYIARKTLARLEEKLGVHPREEEEPEETAHTASVSRPEPAAAASGTKESKGKSQRPQAVFSLSRLYDSNGVLNTEALIKLFFKQPRSSKLKTLGYFFKRGDPQCLPAFVDILHKEEDPFVIASLVKVIGHYGDTSHLTLLQEYLKHEDPRVRANTVEALEMIGDDLIVTLLIPMLQDEDHRVKATTIRAIYNFNQEEAIKLIRRLAASSRENRRDSAVYCLSQIDHREVPAIVTEMLEKEESIELTRKLCSLLEEKGDEEAAARVAHMLADKSPAQASLLKQALEKLQRRLGLDDEHLERLTEKVGSAAPPRKEGTRRSARRKDGDITKTQWSMTSLEREIPALAKKARNSASKTSRSAGSGGNRLETRHLLYAGGVLLLLLAVYLLLPSSPSDHPGNQEAGGPVTAAAGERVDVKGRIFYINKRRKSISILTKEQRVYQIDVSGVPEKTRGKLYMGKWIRVTGYSTGRSSRGAVLMKATSIERLGKRKR